MEDLYNDYLKNLAESSGSKGKLSPTWTEMEQRLDKEMPQKKDRKRGIIFWSVMLLIICGVAGSYWLSAHQEKIKSKDLSKNISNSKHKLIENITPQKIELLAQPNDDKSIQNNQPQATVHHFENGNTSINKISRRIKKLQEKYNQSSSVKNDFKNLDINNSDDFNYNKQLQNGLNLKAPSNGNENNVVQLTIQNPIINKDIPITNKPNEKRTGKDSVIKKIDNGVDSLLFIPGKANTAVFKDKSNPTTKWEIVPTLSADFQLSNVNGFSYPGFLAGVNMHYNINSHWAFKGGLHFNHIRVNSNGDLFFYVPKKDSYSLNYTKIEDIKGFMDALEIPFAVRYTVNPKSKLAIHFSTGLSTIFYLRTNCTYKMLVNNYYRYWNTKEDRDDEYGHTEWLNNLRLATGFSYAVGKGLRIEVEPSYKLPLEELGEGHSRIGAFSVNVSLRIPVLKK